MLVDTSELVEQAHAGGTAVAAFNAITLEHVEAIVAGAERAGRPAIVQISENAVRYHGDVQPLARAAAESIGASSQRLALHLDHVTGLELLHRAAAAGFSSVMFDAASADYAENVARTSAAASWAHANGLWIEAELGYIGGKPGEPTIDAHAPGARTDPGQARDFAAATGVDLLAVALGSRHAMTTPEARIDLDLAARLAAVTGLPLVLHGSTGVVEDQLRAVGPAGLAKVNFGTALNVAATAAVRQTLAEQPTLVDPRRYLGPARSAMTGAVAGKLLACSG